MREVSAKVALESVLKRRLRFSDVVDVPSLGDVCRNISALHRVGMQVYDERGATLIDVPGPGASLCAYVGGFARGRDACAQAQAWARGESLDAPPEGAPHSGQLVVPCSIGCRHLVSALRYEGEVIGRVVFGPYLPDGAGGLVADLATGIGGGFDARRAAELCAEARLVEESALGPVLAHFDAVVGALVFAGQKLHHASERYLASMQDAVREIESKNKELMVINERLRELDRLKSGFLAAVNHELRSPLTSIIGYGEMLEQGMGGPLNAEQAEFVRTILEKSDNLLSLINSLLDLTQIEAGRLKLNFSRCDVAELARQAVTTLLPQARKRRLALEADLPGTMDAPTVDRDKLRQCLVNLLANAVKFTPEGGRIGLALRAEAPAGLLPDGTRAFAFVVEDSGIGIAPEQHDRIFESFYQVDHGSTRRYGGAGIGLAIVKSFVEAHGGRVRVESEAGRFSRFVMAIPYLPPASRSDVAAPF